MNIDNRKAVVWNDWVKWHFSGLLGNYRNFVCAKILGLLSWKFWNALFQIIFLVDW